MFAFPIHKIVDFMTNSTQTKAVEANVNMKIMSNLTFIKPLKLNN